MRAIKQLYPHVGAGKMVDSYSVAYHAALYPNAPAYDVTLRELLDAEVLRRSPEFGLVWQASSTYLAKTPGD